MIYDDGNKQMNIRHILDNFDQSEEYWLMLSKRRLNLGQGQGEGQVWTKDRTKKYHFK